MTDNQDKSESAQGQSGVSPNPEVNPKSSRRRFSASYKLKILEELDSCSSPGDKGSIYRREGLYTSQITDWRKQRNAGALSALNQVRGRKKHIKPETHRIQALEQEMAALKAKLFQAETIIDIQKKSQGYLEAATQTI